MIKSFDQILEKVKGVSKKTIAVAVAQDEPVLEAIKAASDIVNSVLIGDKDKIINEALKAQLDTSKLEIIDEKNPMLAAKKAVELVRSGEADIVMKGLIDTATFLRAILNKETGIKKFDLLSHVAVFEIPDFHRLMILTDAAMVMAPELKDKVQLIKNALIVSRALEIEKAKIAPICAVEVVNPNMQCTLDAAVLSKMSERGQIKDCIIDGPLALDNAISKEAAAHKKIESEVAGNADILLVPNIEAGNVLYKSFVFTSKAKNGGILIGASAPVVLTSRADSYETKLNSIALSILVSEQMK